MSTRQRSQQPTRRQAGLSGPRPAQTASRRDARFLIPLRAFLGVTFTYAGLQKLANPAYLDAHSPTSVQAMILGLRHQSPIGWLLGLSTHAPVITGLAIALGELAVGLATLAGLWVRIAAVGGLLLALTFFLTVSYHTRPYYYGPDIVFVFAWSVPLIRGAWGAWTVDGWVRRRAAVDLDPQRRALVLGGASAGVLAGIGGAAAAVTAVVGRERHVATRPVASTQHPTTRAHASGGGTSSAPPGKQLIRASRVASGQAVRFSDSQGNPAWLVHEPDGTFRAFSAVCTHAGCAVSYSGGVFVCPCHGGSFSGRTGAVLAGPPPSPLPAIRVTVVNGDVRLA
jgi:thiosulfate dehydrogenase (quinone) large subunit